MFIFIRALFLLFVTVFAQEVSAADFYWVGNDDKHYSSPTAACSINNGKSVGAYAGSVFKFTNLIVQTPTAFYCAGQAVSSSGSVLSGDNDVLMGNARRGGDSCPAGSTYNSTTGACDAPAEDPCKSKTGKVYHEYNAGRLGDNDPLILPPLSLCDNSCKYNATKEIKGCARFLDASDGMGLDSLYCVIGYAGAGTSCTSNSPAPGSNFDQPPSKPPSKTDPTMLKDIQCSDWVSNADGTGSRTCTHVGEYKDPGKINCPEGSSGKLVCSPGTPSPAYNKTEITETTTSKTNPDGSKDNTTIKTTDKTVCFGVKPCTSTTAKEQNSDGTKADGTAKEDAKGNCTGTGCKDLGKDSAGDDPSKDPEEEKEEPRVATGGGSCEAPPTCSGDAIDCAVLAEQHKTRCEAKEAGDFPKQKGGIEGLLTGSEFGAPKESEVSAGSIINQGSRFFPSTCPADSTISLSSFGGHSFALSYAPMCFFAESLAPLIVIAATVFAALYVGRAFGGQ